jgi:hypothetical protein
LVEQAVHEAIDAIAAREVRERVVDRALRLGQRVEIPEEGPDVLAFLRGPLHRAMAELLGDSAAAAVLEELTPMAQMAVREGSGVRPSYPRLEIDLEELLDPSVGKSAPLSFEPPPLVDPKLAPREETRASREGTRTDPAPRKELPRVLVASSDPSSVSLLSFALSGIAYVDVASDALAVLEGIELATDRPLVILDARHPTIQADTLVAMSPELPAASRVVLWSSDWELDRLSSLGSGLPDGWVHVGLDAGADEVAAVCRVLLG